MKPWYRIARLLDEDDDRRLVPNYLREDLYDGEGEEDSGSAHFDDSPVRGSSPTMDSANDSANGGQGRPHYSRGGLAEVSMHMWMSFALAVGPPAGTTYRTVNVDRKTWNKFSARSLGRNESCEFSVMEQEGEITPGMMASSARVARGPRARSPTHDKER